MQIVCKSIPIVIERDARLLEPDSSRRQVPAGRGQVRMAEPVADVMIGNAGCLTQTRSELSAEVMKVQSFDSDRLAGLRPDILNFPDLLTDLVPEHELLRAVL